MNNDALIKYQRLVWQFCLIYFSIVCGHLVMNATAGPLLSHLGVKIVLIATISQLVIMGYQFRKAGNRRFMSLSYVLLIVILASSLAGAFLI